VLTELSKRLEEALAVRRKRKMVLMIGTESVARRRRRNAMNKNTGTRRPS
jgi:hypothetical protein